MHRHAMQRDHVRLHRSLAVLGPPRRFQLMLLLLSGVDRSVSQLARAVRLSQSCTTRHLQALERAGLVKGLRDGKRVVFRPAPKDATARGVLESLLRSEDVANEAALLAAGIHAGAIPIASTAELEPLTESVPAERPRRKPRRRVIRAAPVAMERDVVAVAGESRAEIGAGGMDEEVAAGEARVDESAFEPEFEHVFRPTPREEPESGNTSAPHEPRPRYSSDIEDFLL